MSAVPIFIVNSTAPATKYDKVLDRIVVLVLVLLSGHPVLLRYGADVMLVCFFLFLLFLGALRGVKPQLSDLVVIVSFVAISAYHILEFSPSILSAVAGFLVKLLIAFLCARTIRDFEWTYVEVMYVLAFVSLLIFGLFQSLHIFGINPHAALAPFSLLDDGRVDIGLQNFNRLDDAYRNSGMFWEPGAFAGYLLLGIVFLAVRRDAYTSNFYRRRLAVFAITLLSTLSTIGFLAAPIALLLHLRSSLVKRPAHLHVSAKIGLTMIVVVFCVMMASQLPFLWPKIESQLGDVTSQARGWETTRFGSALYDSEFIVERPLLGWSAHPATRESIDPSVSEVLKSNGNGLSTFVVQFGILGLLIVVFSTFRSVMRLFQGRRTHALASVLVIFMLTNGEQYLEFPLFLTVMFVGKLSAWAAIQMRPFSGNLD